MLKKIWGMIYDKAQKNEERTIPRIEILRLEQRLNQAIRVAEENSGTHFKTEDVIHIIKSIQKEVWIILEEVK